MTQVQKVSPRTTPRTPPEMGSLSQPCTQVILASVYPVYLQPVNWGGAEPSGSYPMDLPSVGASSHTHCFPSRLPPRPAQGRGCPAQCPGSSGPAEGGTPEAGSRAPGKHSSCEPGEAEDAGRTPGRWLQTNQRRSSERGSWGAHSPAQLSWKWSSTLFYKSMKLRSSGKGRAGKGQN